MNAPVATDKMTYLRTRSARTDAGSSLASAERSSLLGDAVGLTRVTVSLRASDACSIRC